MPVFKWEEHHVKLSISIIAVILSKVQGLVISYSVSLRFGMAVKAFYSISECRKLPVKNAYVQIPHIVFNFTKPV